MKTLNSTQLTEGNMSEIQLFKRRRPCSLTPEVQAQIVQFVREGSYFATACRAVGLDPSGLYRWIRRAELNDPRTAEFSQFIHALKSAECFAEAESLRAIRNAVDDSWIAHAQFLERRFPQRWGRRRRTPALPPPRPAKPLARMTDSELAEYERRLS